jgi:aspartate-semialdehyde dehydrogenase
LGATGLVGQGIVTLLSNHPRFRLAELIASPRSAGKTYRDAVVWRQQAPLDPAIGGLQVLGPDAALASAIVFSSATSSVSTEMEQRYSSEGRLVISNASGHRMDEHVPLVVPEVNASHLELVCGRSGAIVTNCNCAAMFVAMVLGPLHEAYSVEAVQVTTLQAVSGGGYPGVPSLDILGNIVPLPGEEQKIEQELQKMLGRVVDDRVEPAAFPVSANCHRVPVIDGHTSSLSVRLGREVAPAEVARTLATHQGPLRLPSAPALPIVVTDVDDRPQPRLDVNQGDGLIATVGRIRRCPVLTVKMLVLGHNLVRGAAAGAVLNAEALDAMNLLPT